MPNPMKQLTALLLLPFGLLLFTFPAQAQTSFGSRLAQEGVVCGVERVTAGPSFTECVAQVDAVAKSGLSARDSRLIFLALNGSHLACDAETLQIQTLLNEDELDLPAIAAARADYLHCEQITISAIERSL